MKKLLLRTTYEEINIHDYFMQNDMNIHDYFTKK